MLNVLFYTCVSLLCLMVSPGKFVPQPNTVMVIITHSSWLWVVRCVLEIRADISWPINRRSNNEENFSKAGILGERNAKSEKVQSSREDEYESVEWEWRTYQGSWEGSSCRWELEECEGQGSEMVVGDNWSVGAGWYASTYAAPRG